MTSFWTGSSQVMKHGLHTLHHKTRSSLCIGVTMDLPARRNSSTLSERKLMCMVFWDRLDILLVDFQTRGETVNTESYCETLQKLRWVIQDKRRGLLSADVVLLHDNARPHTARRSTHLLQSSARRCLIIHFIVRTSRPLISIFSYTSGNSCPISITVFRMTARRR